MPVWEILDVSPRMNVQYFPYSPDRHVITDLQPGYEQFGSLVAKKANIPSLWARGSDSWLTQRSSQLFQRSLVFSVSVRIAIREGLYLINETRTQRTGYSLEVRKLMHLDCLIIITIKIFWLIFIVELDKLSPRKCTVAWKGFPTFCVSSLFRLCTSVYYCVLSTIKTQIK